MKFHFNYYQKILVSLAVFVISVNFQMPVKAQNVVTRQQLDRLSLPELRILRREQIRQARIVLKNCYVNGYINGYINRSSCDIIRLQYNNYFANLNNYIAQREVLGQ